MNADKMRRQANEFRSRLLGGDYSSRRGATVAVGSVVDAVEGIDASWATPLLVKVWHSSLGGVATAQGPSNEIDLLMRPAVKRALVELRVRGAVGHRRSHDALTGLLAACAEAILQEVTEFMPEFRRDGVDPELFILRSTGEALQLGVDARSIRQFADLAAIADVAHGADPAGALAHLPHLRNVPRGDQYRSLWDGLYLRCALAFSILRFDPDGIDDVAFLPRNFFSQSAFLDAEGSTLMHFGADDIRSLLVAEHLAGKPGKKDQLITANPLHPVDGGYVTSLRLVLDSIAPWLQQKILALDLWKPVVSDPFEHELADLLRSLGLVAGSVNDAGNWAVGPGAVPAAVSRVVDALRAAPPSPGEIDILAWDPALSVMLVIECKSVNAIGNLQTISQTLSDADAEQWRSKLQKKARWVEEATGVTPDWCVVALEGIEYTADVSEDEIPIVQRSMLEGVLVEALAVAGSPDIRH